VVAPSTSQILRSTNLTTDARITLGVILAALALLPAGRVSHAVVHGSAVAGVAIGVTDAGAAFSEFSNREDGYTCTRG
jgi:hypothetical protein